MVPWGWSYVTGFTVNLSHTCDNKTNLSKGPHIKVVTGGLLQPVELHSKSHFGTYNNGLMYQGGHSGEWSLKTGLTVILVQ